MSLESGTTLCRLNHELLPDPGSPMASTTIPLGGRGGAAGMRPGGVEVCGTETAASAAAGLRLFGGPRRASDLQCQR